MKLLKYLSIAAIALMSVACSDDDDNPTIKSPGVYFGEDNTAETMLSPVEGAPTSFEVSVWRTENKGQQTVDITYTADDANVFTVPATASFADGAYKTTFTVDCSLAGWEIGKSHEITFKLGGDYVSDYAYAGEFTKKVTLFYTFKKVGKSYMQDNWITVLFTSEFEQPIPVYEVEVEEAEQLAGYYRIVNPYGSNFCASAVAASSLSLKAGYDESKESKYIYVHAEDENFIWVERQAVTGLPRAISFSQEVGDAIGFQVAKGATIEELKASSPNNFMYKESNGAIWFKGSCARFSYVNGGNLLDNNGNGYSNVGDPAMLITAPGKAYEDFNASLEYVGVLAVDNKGTQAMVKQSYGADVKYAKYTLIAGVPQDMDAVYNGINDGTIESEWSNLEEPYLFAPVSESGAYTLAVVTYGHDNEIAKGHGAVSFNVTIGTAKPTDGFKEIGLAQVVDGWIICGWGKKNPDGSVTPNNAYENRYQAPLWQSSSAPGMYGLLSPYGSNVWGGKYVSQLGNKAGNLEVLVKFDVSNTNLIKIPTQYCGFTSDATGEVSIANIEGVIIAVNAGITDERVISFMTEKNMQFTTFVNGVVTVPNPQWYWTDGSNKGDWYNWANPQNAQIYLPGSYNAAIAANLAASRKAPGSASVKMSSIKTGNVKIATAKVQSIAPRF